MRDEITRKVTRPRLSSGRCGIVLLLAIALLALPGPATAAAPDPSSVPPTSSFPKDLEERRGIDWASVAVGAGAVLALVALGGATVLSVRRRTGRPGNGND